MIWIWFVLCIETGVLSDVLDLDDILNAQYLPSTLVLEEAAIIEGVNTSQPGAHYLNATTTGEANFRDAYLTMQFHRSMMNEYLCRGYVADEILSELVKGERRVAERRRGRPAPRTTTNPTNNHLMEDQGSSSYKDWLTRSTVLDDVYKHYDQVMSADGDNSVPADGDSSDTMSIESGEVTGYAVQEGAGKIMPSATQVHQHHHHQIPPSSHSYNYGSSGGGGGGGVGVGHYGVGGGAGDHFGGGLSGHGVAGGGYGPGPGPGYGVGGGYAAGGGYGTTGYPAGPDYHHSPGHYSYPAPGYGHSSHGGGLGVDYGYSYHHHPSSSGKKSGLALKDLFDLALTALAFLAFGMFIMHLILTCMMGPMGPTIVMHTTSTTTTTTARGGKRKRVPRSSPDQENELNELAYRVLTSIDRVMELYDGRSSASTRCLRYTLCQNNSYSRSMSTDAKLWLPVWSFGISWLIGRLGEDRLENLRAAVLGLANADCKKIYPSCRIGDSV